jgi:hypothetical protein
MAFNRLRLQIPPSPLRPHFVKAPGEGPPYHDGAHAILLTGRPNALFVPGHAPPKPDKLISYRPPNRRNDPGRVARPKCLPADNVIHEPRVDSRKARRGLSEAAGRKTGESLQLSRGLSEAKANRVFKYLPASSVFRKSTLRFVEKPASLADMCFGKQRNSYG